MLAQSAAGYQLTWMDAKVNGWVVTPRRGKPVEINALWFNALKLMEQWADRQGDSAAGEYRELAERARRSFNERCCIGSISEIYDAEPPFTPRGCIAQAWSVGEVLRV